MQNLEETLDNFELEIKDIRYMRDTLAERNRRVARDLKISPNTEKEKLLKQDVIRRIKYDMRLNELLTNFCKLTNFPITDMRDYFGIYALTTKDKEILENGTV